MAVESAVSCFSFRKHLPYKKDELILVMRVISKKIMYTILLNDDTFWTKNVESLMRRSKHHDAFYCSLPVNK